ncbi:hypothetical protein OG535_35920 [Kitasatospora sp. NBC_00085]|uniref:hypothetical protein n=1 Tax=Kitasatospora sp. NBC_00085 TaxID=2903566 RepID=UPI0032439AD2
MAGTATAARVALTALLLGLAGVVWFLGMMAGFDTRPTRPCVNAIEGGWSAQGYRAPEHQGIRFDEGFFPPSHVCRWPDGRSVELVPWWNAPLFLGALAGAVAVPVAPLVRRRRPARSGGPQSAPESRAVHTDG